MDDMDMARLAQIAAVMGAAQLRALAGQLADGLADLKATAGEARFLALHRLRGGAASLGYAGLARAIEAAEASGDVALVMAGADRVVPAMDAALQHLSAQR